MEGLWELILLLVKMLGKLECQHRSMLGSVLVVLLQKPRCHLVPSPRNELRPSSLKLCPAALLGKYSPLRVP